MTGNGDITVVISCFNYGRYLEEAVDSALTQHGGSPKVIVVDDGSTDPETVATLDRLPAQVDVFRQENQGASRARNAGLRRAATPYLLVLDADDRLSDGALRNLREPLDRDPALGFAYGHSCYFGEWEGVLRFPPYDPYRLLYRHIVGLSALMRRELVEATAGYDPELEHYEDWEIWIHALAEGWRGVQVEAVTLEYRRHNGSKFASDRVNYREWFRRIRTKHAALYQDKALARDSDLGLLGRAAYRYFWGLRPIPASVEQRAHALHWRRGKPD